MAMIKRDDFIKRFTFNLQQQMTLKLPEEAAEVEFLIRMQDILRLMIEGCKEDNFWTW